MIFFRYESILLQNSAFYPSFKGSFDTFSIEKGVMSSIFVMRERMLRLQYFSTRNAPENRIPQFVRSLNSICFDEYWTCSRSSMVWNKVLLRYRHVYWVDVDDDKWQIKCETFVTSQFQRYLFTVGGNNKIFVGSRNVSKMYILSHRPIGFKDLIFFSVEDCCRRRIAEEEESL